MRCESGISILALGCKFSANLIFHPVEADINLPDSRQRHEDLQRGLREHPRKILMPFSAFWFGCFDALLLSVILLTLVTATIILVQL